MPPELEGGVYSNFFNAWHSEHEFTIDFASRQIPLVEEPDEPESAAFVRCPVVSRVKLPVTLAFELIRSLNAVMTEYEAQYGEIRRPGAQE